MKTKWKVTGNFVITIVAVVMLVVIINILTIFGVYIFNMVSHKNTITLKNSPETFVRNFEKYMYDDNGILALSEEGSELLQESGAWIQVLNDYGEEISNINSPSDVPKKYTPFDMVNNYKYEERPYINFMLEKNLSSGHVNVILALPNNNIERVTLNFSLDSVMYQTKIIIIITLIIDAIIALIFGYLFSRKLTKPISEIITNIDILSKGNYNLYTKEKGIYKAVFENINDLSSTLRENENQRKELESMREEWLANITHDIKTPLASIQGYAEIISDKDYEFTRDEMQEYTEIIYSKSKYIRELVDELNLSTRLKNNALSLNKQNTNLVALLRNVVIDILNDSRYENRNIEFNSNIDVIEKEVDVMLLKRALTNLIFNAVVHNNESVQVKVEIKKIDKINISIKDNGNGINTKDLKHIFDRYYRGTNTGEVHKGSGLGMAISKEIINNHGGEIQINSKLGCGTEILITL
ncbi:MULTISPECIES: sensor histidine kinase [Clostridium]|uniref:sensor histidine kinase n=1 Tax=Clostridium TaxID=1485 RepID=UPI0011DD472A|nr:MULTISPECIES: HAMP domain-containing sensor histidine kinase [Clostridium]MDU4853595.1 HAMP domain-containing sensor histidine kinase [Clostridioides difficile]MBS4842074.1 HAMP domain-containing histidine kinase [Clostridium sp.]MDB2151730.1 HAMP domain-containing sensor histidine kinase [Clostridium butyricum]MDU1071303.1 HAMP domain-containing sensor histidine kinase [Clostridium sp.]MDU1403310.1 HAMP domain-containing sensor histidine kinase [Clostridium sp.]